MKALILVADGFEDSEFLYPLYRLQEEGIDVDVAGPETTTFTGKHGYTADANMTFSQVDTAEYDALVLPGGKAPETVRLDQDAIQITKNMVIARKVVAAICHGAQTLISAGVLDGRKATCWKGIRDDLRAAGATYCDEQVVIDGNLITSRCPEDLPAFSRALFDNLGE